MTITIFIADTIGLKKSRILLKVLLDTSSTSTMISRSVLPKDIQPKKLQSRKAVAMLASMRTATEMVWTRGIKWPEFEKNRQIDKQKCLVFDEKCRYDVILGADFLTKAGIDMCATATEP